MAGRPLHRIGWFGLGVPIAIATALSGLIYVGTLGTLPKVLGFHFAFYPRGAIGAGKMLVASLSLLIGLRLAPRLLLGLWNIPPGSALGSVLFGIFVAASLANTNWFTPVPILAAPLAMVSLAGLAAGAEAASQIRRRSWSRTVQPSDATDDGFRQARRWRTAAWALGTILGIVVAGELVHFGEILRLSLNGEFGEALGTVLVDLYGLHRVMDTVNRLANEMDLTASVWAWCFCFATSAAVTLRSRVVSSGDGPL